MDKEYTVDYVNVGIHYFKTLKLLSIDTLYIDDIYSECCYCGIKNQIFKII